MMCVCAVLNKLDDFSNAMVQMEEMFPFSNQTPFPVGKLPDDPEVQLANLFGFAGTLFFAIPDNLELRALGERIDDRLFKIRHSQDISGTLRKLPLFEPPIDPALLVQAAAQGVSLNSVLNDLNGPMPNYRFPYLLDRALALASECKSLGQSLLGAREKQDAETYAVLRAKHDSTTQTILLDMKKLALEEATRSLEALEHSRRGPENRMRYYLQLAGEQLASVPGAAAADADFQALSEKLQTPIEVGGLKLIPSEKEEMDLGSKAATLTMVSGAFETLASYFNAIPFTNAHATPLGCGIAVGWGGQNLGSVASAVARGISTASADAQYRAGVAGRHGLATRALSDRLQAANAAGFELSTLNRQVAAARVRVALAARDVEVQRTQIAQAHEAEAVLRARYAAAELYGWLAGQTRRLFSSTYAQALELARKTEKVLRFERPHAVAAAAAAAAAGGGASSSSSSSLIQPGFWDVGRDGLLAGEQLHYALKQMEAAYLAERGHDYEVVKTLSLRVVDPMQLLRLRDEGVAEFAVPELLFDLDFPGHYARRIKAVTVTVPCVIGPYASVNATLRLLSNRFRATPSLAGGYNERVDGDGAAASDERFATSNVPVAAVAVSHANGDAGVFELQFAGERYLPFEGAGVVAAWRLELPPLALRPFDYGSIADVVMQIRYTSREGGEQLRAAATAEASAFVSGTAEAGGGLFAFFDIRNEFASSWARVLQGGTRHLDMLHLQAKVPLLAAGRANGSIVAQDVWVVSQESLPDGDLQLDVVGETSQKNQATLVKQEGSFQGLNTYGAIGARIVLSHWKLTLPEGKIESERLWVLVRYTCTMA